MNWHPPLPLVFSILLLSIIDYPICSLIYLIMIVCGEFQLPYHFTLSSFIRLNSIPPYYTPSFIHNAKVRTSVFITRWYGKLFLDINGTVQTPFPIIRLHGATQICVNKQTFLRDWCILRTKRHCIATLVFSNKMMVLCSGLHLSTQPYGIMQGSPQFPIITKALYSEFQHPFFKI